MQKWEYCMITGIRGDDVNHPRLVMFKDSGSKLAELDKYILWDHKVGKSWRDFLNKPLPGFIIPEEATHSKQLTNMIIGYLGGVGWEMVGCGNTLDYEHSIYFKRQIEDK